MDVLIKRLKLSKKADEIIIATTPDKKNSLIIDIAKSYNLSYFIGSEENVLERYFLAANEYNINLIVRITSDCPFIDPKIIDGMINFYKNNNYNFLRNVDCKNAYPIGFDVEIFSFEILEKISLSETSNEEKEHVTHYILNHPEIFSIFTYKDDGVKFFEDLRLCIDYQEDLTMLREVFKRLKKNGKSIDFKLSDVLEIVEKDPEIMSINKKYKWRR